MIDVAAISEREDVDLLPPKPDLKINSGMRISLILIEKLDWIAERENRSRMEVLEGFASYGIEQYEKEKGITVQRKPFVHGRSPGRPRRK